MSVARASAEGKSHQTLARANQVPCGFARGVKFATEIAMLSCRLCL